MAARSGNTGSSYHARRGGQQRLECKRTSLAPGRGVVDSQRAAIVVNRQHPVTQTVSMVFIIPGSIGLGLSRAQSRIAIAAAWLKRKRSPGGLTARTY